MMSLTRPPRVCLAPRHAPCPARHRLIARVACKTTFSSDDADDEEDLSRRMDMYDKITNMAHCRKQLNDLYYENRKHDLTGEELKDLMGGRRPLMAVYENEVVLEIHAEMWDAEDILWESLAGIFNDWSCSPHVRHTIPSAIMVADGDFPIIVPLNVHSMFMRDMPEYPEF